MKNNQFPFLSRRLSKLRYRNLRTINDISEYQVCCDIFCKHCELSSITLTINTSTIDPVAERIFTVCKKCQNSNLIFDRYTDGYDGNLVLRKINSSNICYDHSDVIKRHLDFIHVCISFSIEKEELMEISREYNIEMSELFDNIAIYTSERDKMRGALPLWSADLA